MPEETNTARRHEDIALDLMKFVAMTTGYGKPVGGAGFQAKPEKSTEDYAESLLQLYTRGKEVVGK
jgi:hypothetical protein